MKNIIKKILEEHIEVIRTLDNYSELIQQVAKDISAVLENGRKIMLCGNGGSAADSQHLATEFVVRFRSELNRRSLPALALTTDTSLITAGANDYGFDTIFSRQVEGLGNRGDYLIGISTSGNSENVFQAIRTAKEKGIHTLLLSGKDGGKIKSVADDSLIIPHKNTARIQEAHITIGHIICLLVEINLFKNN
ncbi:MAG: D-sedoheptulose 7-phosphate isomerase [Candidatus Cloacimonadota bacterium]|nr:D-sedoheptulose 7-phosphate isomerase [Candidatus Cloacimonadota bacterium]